MLKRNFDQTQYVVRDPGDWQGAAFIFSKVNDAFEFWQQAENHEAFEFNLAEGICRDLTDDFRDWLSEDEREARAWNRHCASYARAL